MAVDVGPQPDGHRQIGVSELRGRVWLSFLEHRTGLAGADFAKRYIYRGRSRSGLVAKWERGSVAPCLQTAKAIDAKIPGTLAVFCHPIFDLLRDTPTFDRRVWRTIGVLPSVPRKDGKAKGLKLSEWKHLSEIQPETHRTANRPLSTPEWVRPDPWQLKCKPSLYSLTRMIGLLRVVEDPRYIDKHAIWAQEVFRLMPASLQESWLAPHLDAFIDHVDVIRGRVPGSAVESFTVDRCLMREQLGWKNFRPLYRPGHRELDPIRMNQIPPNRMASLKPDTRRVVDLGVV